MQSEKNSGFRSIFGLSAAYNFAQRMITRKPIWTDILYELTQANKENLKVLDIGCGTGNFLAGNYIQVKEENYTGIEPQENYINSARKKFPKAQILHGYVADFNLDNQFFDLVILGGLIHHCDDSQVLEVLDYSYKKLSPGGIIISVDPVVFDGQNVIARSMALADRGQHVRNPEAMKRLYKSVALYAEDVDISIKRGYLRVPYNHIVCVTKKPEIFSPEKS